VQVAPHPATRPAATAGPLAASPAAEGHGHPLTTAADLLSRYGWRRPQAGRVYQSVLTGNVRTLAEVKLSAVGLRHPLDLCIGAYGDDHEVRAELVHLARRRASAVYGGPLSDFSGQATVVVGDTPLDVMAALAAGARAVGVATGGYPASALREAGAHAVLADLTNAAAVLSALLA
jgi:phosphoglycolate phosphatase-like HAD superfamily hydrolase